MKYNSVQNFINGSFANSTGDKTLDVISPIDGTWLSTVPFSLAQDLDAAVKSEKQAFPGWSKTPVKERVQVFFKYKTLLEKNINAIFFWRTDRKSFWCWRYYGQKFYCVLDQA